MAIVPRGSLDPWYVTGLAESTGSFTFNRTSHNITLVFSVKVAEKDRDLLEELQSFFGVGSIYAVRASGSALFKITRNDGLQAVVEHFTAYPLRTKRAAWETWREMVALKSASFRRPPMDKLNALADQLSAARKS